ncbi:MAG: hypothetical protein HGB26_08885 [Desulfobulbaceae bacterium]|nr:hypothetical protein [Desulfobulbaceae bacterium]
MDLFNLSTEYYKLTDIIDDFDNRILQIKSRGVTFGLATIARGFKEKARGLFLLAAVSGICFWVILAETKWHQTNYFLRMNEIEYSCQQDVNTSTLNCQK